jgi:hypothetical protein
MSDFVTRAEWDAYCRQEREKYFSQREERDRKAHAKWQKENDKLLNPPPKPPPRREEPREPTIEDASYADFIFLQGHGLLGKVDVDEGDARGTEVKRKPTVKRKSGGNLVDTYT